MASSAPAAPPSLVHATAPVAESGRALLLVLHVTPDAVRVVDARTADVRVRLRPWRPSDEEDLVVSLADARGEPLVVVRARIPLRLHGPLDGPEAGDVHCRAVDLDDVVMPLRLPLPDGAETLAFHELGETAPRGAVDLVRGLRSDAATAGLRELGVHGVASLLGSSP